MQKNIYTLIIYHHDNESYNSVFRDFESSPKELYIIYALRKTRCLVRYISTHSGINQAVVLSNDDGPISTALIGGQVDYSEDGR